MSRKADSRVYLPLCFRCHHRAAYLESGGTHRPRLECGETSRAVCGCYMYRPPWPLRLAPRDGDRRPVGGPAMIAARLIAVGEAKGEWVLRRQRRAWVMLWRLAAPAARKLGIGFRIRELWQRVLVSLGCAALYLLAALASAFTKRKGRGGA